MSIQGRYRRITSQEFAKLQRDPDAAAAFFGDELNDLDDEAFFAKLDEQESSDRYLDIGKNWHALHFLLTGDGELGEHAKPLSPPLGNVVQGGTETQWECTYGYVRSLTPDEVRAVADALANISVEELRSRFNTASFDAAKIYPRGGLAGWTDEGAESVFEVYPRVVEFFQAAAKDGDMVLLSSD